MRFFISLFLALSLPSLAFATGSVTVSRQKLSYNKLAIEKYVEIVTISWTADASAATIPTTVITLRGYSIKALTKPGGTAPTANYDVVFGDPLDSTVDALGGALAARSASATEMKQPVLTGGVSPVFLAGDYSFAVKNNSVNSATGTVVLYLVD
jgi:hypothetical protein